MVSISRRTHAEPECWPGLPPFREGRVEAVPGLRATTASASHRAKSVRFTARGGAGRGGAAGPLGKLLGHSTAGTAQAAVLKGLSTQIPRLSREHPELGTPAEVPGGRATQRQQTAQVVDSLLVIHASTVLPGSAGLRSAAKCTHASR